MMRFSNRRFWQLLGLLLLVASVSRLWIVDHRLPDIQITDENSDLSTALRLFQGELPPAHYRYHRVLTSNVDLLGVAGLLGYSVLSGRIQSLDDFQELYYRERGLFTLATRLMMASLTVVAIALTALAGRFFSNEVGIFAALMLTLNSFFAMNSVYALPDTLIIFAMAVLLWLTLRLWHYQRRRDYMLMGVGLALVMLAKISAAPAGIGFLVVHGAIVYRQTGKHGLQFVRHYVFSLNLWLAALSTLIFNVVFNPVAFIHLDDLLFEINNLFFHAYARRPPTSWDVRLAASQAQVLQMVAYLWRWYLPLTVAGVVVILVRHWRSVAYWAVVLMALATFVPVALVYSQEYKVFYWTPFLIPLALITGIGAAAIWHFALQHKQYRWLVLIVCVPFVLETLMLAKISDKMRQPDTRELAYQYVLANWTPETRVMSGDPQVFSVPFKRNTESIQRALRYGAVPLNGWDWWLNLPETEQPWQTHTLYSFEVRNIIKTSDELRQYLLDERIEYYITAELCNDSVPLTDTESPVFFPPDAAQLADMLEEVAVFSPFAVHECLTELNTRTNLAAPDHLDLQLYTGPLIRIYRVLLPPAVAVSTSDRRY
jgi:4-amino-4-deoxy-L-arabinose transferase-like glycosyltransferase